MPKTPLFIIVCIVASSLMGEAEAQTGRHPADVFDTPEHGLEDALSHAMETKLAWLARARLECDLNCEIAQETKGDPGVSADMGPFPVVSLQPYFAEKSPYHKARALVARGDCEGALKALDTLKATCGDAPCEGQHAVALLRVEARWCAGDREGAWTDASRLAREGYPGMEREVHAWLERIAKRLGKPAPAPLSPSMAVHGRAYLKMALGRAAALAKEGRVDDALALLEHLEGEVYKKRDRHKVLLARVRVLEQAARVAPAAQIVKDLWLEELSGGDALAERLERLAGLSDEVEPLGKEERLDRIAALASKGKETKGAIKRYVKAYRVRPREVRALKFLVSGLEHEAEREREDACDDLKKVLKWSKDPHVKARALFGLGRALRRLHKDEDAVATYLRIIHDYPDDNHVDDAFLQAARLELYRGHVETARKLVGNLLELHPESALAPDALWIGAWTAWLSEDFEEALGLLTRLSQRHGDVRDLSGLSMEVKALYWRARCLSRLGQVAEAVDGFRYVVERFPVTYYAALAYRQIEAHGVDPVAAVPFQVSLQEPVSTLALRELEGVMVPAHPRARRAIELWRLGRRGEAKTELGVQLRFAGAPRGVVELASTFHLLEGNVSTSFWMAARHGDFSVAPYAGNARLWGLAYPAPPEYLKVAHTVGQEIGMDPLLAFAVMRHESGFKADAVSGVGAVGLMQVMPGTAKMISRMWYRDRKGPSRKKLSKPKTNIRMGLTLLRMERSYFHGNLPLMIGGYNAGTGVATRWFNQYQESLGETDALVEMMTYPKTVAYLKKVIGSYYAYRVLYGDGTPPPIPLALPESLREWGEPDGEMLVGQRMSR